MRNVCALLACCAALLLVAEAAEYTNKYDGIDVDRILQNGRVLSNYIKCMLDEGSCTAEGRELKSECMQRLIRAARLRFGTDYGGGRRLRPR